ncbi:TlpA family protein disulfide reductase [Sorangium sp. So ce887]|uniref:TlpA family protein disulfide reductase n=1 Tax=Sorangium sp. So ce887 TaxID=3133324 RepID=UPI003F63FA92
MDMLIRPPAPRRPRPARLLSAASAATLAVALVSGAALALPPVGDRAPNARVEDADGRELQLKALRGKPILIVYEDKDSTTQNQALKDALAKLAKGDRYKRSIAVTAIADVSSYDFWPAKGFVKDAIRDESRKVGATIYCDWDGTFREAYRLRRGISNVILVGKNGQVLFAAEGKLKPEAQTRVLDLLRKEVDG